MKSKSRLLKGGSFVSRKSLTITMTEPRMPGIDLFGGGQTEICKPLAVKLAFLMLLRMTD